MYCPTCGMMHYACRCFNRPITPPPPVSMIHPTYGNVGTVNPATGFINAPGQSYHGTQIGQFGQISGTNLQIGPGGIIQQMGP